tara:strand:+ start:2232 stop:2999 length:768 start_codon:yes stop_codon:yes gene_type:complete
MNQQDKTLWITGDSFGTFDKTNQIHWVKEFARWHDCTRIFNLSRGGFDNGAIYYVSSEIISNSPWPGRDDDEDFIYDQDILLIFNSSADRFSHLTSPSKQFDSKLSIGNLNWHNNWALEQMPMPWIDHMPKESNIFSQTLTTIASEHSTEDRLRLPVSDDVIQYAKDTLLFYSLEWNEVRNSQQLAGIINLFESRTTGAKLYTINNNYHMPQVAKYKLPNVGDLIGETPEVEETLVNHMTPAEHVKYFDCLMDYL